MHIQHEPIFSLNVFSSHSLILTTSIRFSNHQPDSTANNSILLEFFANHNSNPKYQRSHSIDTCTWHGTTYLHERFRITSPPPRYDSCLSGNGRCSCSMLCDSTTRGTGIHLLNYYSLDGKRPDLVYLYAIATAHCKVDIET